MRHFKILLIIFVGLLLGILLSSGNETVYVQALGPACPVEISAYFQLEESSAPYADSLGGPQATCTDCPTTTPGKVGMSQQFNGTSNEVSVADQGQYDWGASDEFSIEYWMNSTSNCVGNEVHVGRQGTAHPKPHWWVGCYETGQGAAFVLFDKNGDDGDSSTENQFAFGTTDITDGQWHHIVAVKDATHIRIYVDGSEEDAVSKNYIDGFDSTTPLNIGFLNFSASLRFRYEGTLDEIATYDKALTPAEIQQHYNSGNSGPPGEEHCSVPPNITSAPVTNAYLGVAYSYNVEVTGVPAPTFSLTDAPADMNIDSTTGLITWTPSSSSDVSVTLAATNGATPDATQTFTINISEACSGDLAAYWKLDESSSGSYADWLGTHNGSCAGVCPAPTASGRIDGAQVFNGSNTGIDIAADPVFDWGYNDNFSIEFWMKRPGQCPLPENVLDNEVVVGRNDVSSDNHLHWWVGVSCLDQGKALFTLNDSDTGDDDTATAVSNTVITGGAWHHVVAVRDGDAQELRLYVDGQLESTVQNATFSSGFGSSAAAINLGWLNHSVGGFNFEGTQDEVAIYKRVLSPMEIKSHYHLGRGYCEACASVIKIMPLANSIGYGNSSGVVPDESQYFTAWRKDLWDTLKAGDYFVDFIGANKAGEYYESSGFDADNAAYPGAKPWQIYNLLNTGQPPATSNPLEGAPGPYLEYYPPDVILLHIGTNGIDLSTVEDHVQNVAKILDEIDEYETAQNKTIPVVLALIINQNPYHAKTTTFNGALATMASKRISDPTDPAYPDNIIVVNMETGTESADGTPFDYAPYPTGDMWDTLHPYATGYTKMANTWFNGDSLGSDGLVDFLPVCGDSQLIQLKAGWNLVSSYINPRDPDLDVVLANIVDDMVLVKNGAGQVYWPSVPVDDIGSWNPQEGYYIYMNNAVDLAISGTKIVPENTPIDLITGWNHIAYLRDNPHPIADALSTISAQLFLAISGNGEIYWPKYSTYQIGDMQPGLGYQVYLTADGQLTYPANAAVSTDAGPLSKERRSKP